MAQTLPPNTAAAVRSSTSSSRAGAETFHGSAYDYIQNDDLDARSYFNNGAKAKVRYNYFGGSLGGPIMKNKMFFYYNYQQLKNPNSAFNTTKSQLQPCRQVVSILSFLEML